ncbi:DUF4352 domain-containing protein [Cytobacillus massiliigabonensis]|uniref:DUF4352 domain-containing protein n=1 Tax=Cytobacillus massiliigabonensis TaxID=1871011 RepID=UPI000C840342|nr:DUF4352 domain-containing protein [Cytobacillus massiliigabonensis]
MRKIIVLLGTIGISLSILAACSSDTTEKEAKPINVDINNKKEKNENVQVLGDNNQDTEADKVEVTNLGNLEDQIDLKIGDTGQTETTIGKYAITIDSVTMKDEIDGKTSMFDHFFIAGITVDNIGNDPMNVLDIIDNLELSSDIDGGGAGDYSKNYQSIKALSGVIEPGKSITGEIVFHGLDSETYYIRTKKGLVKSGAVKNNTVWTFDKSEAQ